MDLHLDLRRDGRKMRAQLEEQLRDGVRSGRLRPGTPLPPSRTLARELGVSRGVVVEAYAQLAAEGFLVARQGAGTVVAPGGARPAPREGGRGPVSRDDGRGAPPRHAGLPPARHDLRTGRPDLAAFPRAAWAAATARVLRAAPDAALDYGDPRGAEHLRAVLAARLGRTRGILAQPGDVVLSAGVTQGLTLVWRALRDAGARRVGVEDPGWATQRFTARDAGLITVPIPVDERGLDVDALAAAGVDAVAVTPAHQFPTAVVLAPERRAALVAWAARTGGVIVEDDYDAEHRFDRDPVGALQGLAPDHVVYAGSASKTLAPGLRAGWLVLPPRLTTAVANERLRADHGGSALVELTLADLLERGEVDRHLRRMRRRYRDRRDALLQALAHHLPEARVGGVAAGLHAVVWLPAGTDERAVAAAARARGVEVPALHADCACTGSRDPALLLGFAALPEPALRHAAAL